MKTNISSQAVAPTNDIQALARRNAQLHTAAEVARAASSIQDLQTLIQQTVTLVQEQFGFYYVGLFLLDEAGEQAVLRAGTGEAGDRMLAEGHCLSIGDESMIGWCIAHRRARIALDVEKDAVHFKNPHLPEARSELALPLIFQDQPIGALTVQSEKEGAFTAEDIKVLGTLANQLAVAIENARLQESLKRSQEYFRALTENTQDVFLVLDAEGITRYVSPVMEHVLGYDAAERLNRDPLELVHPEDVPTARAALTKLYRHPEDPVTFSIRAQHKDGKWRLLEVAARNCLADPAVEGIILHYQDITVRHAATQAVLQRNRDLEMLNTIAATLNHTLNISQLLEGTLEHLTKLFKLRSAWVFLYNNQNGSFQMAAARGLPPELMADLEQRKTPCSCQLALLGGTLGSSVNILDCQRLQENPVQGLRIHASIPLYDGEQQIGIINLAAENSLSFTPEHLRLLTTIGHQVSVAVTRAQLHEQAKARHINEQNALLRLSQSLLDTRTSQGVLEIAVKEAAHSLRAELAIITLLDSEKAHFSIVAQHGWPTDGWKEVHHVPVDDSTDMGRAILARRAVAIPDARQQPDNRAPYPVSALGVVARLIVPMLMDGHPLGALVVNERQPRVWSEDDIRLLSLIANETAQALERARLAETEQRREAIIEAVNFAASAFLHSTWWEKDIQAVLTRLGEAAEADRVYIFQNHRRADGELLTSQRYEWVRDGIQPQIDHPDLQDFPFSQNLPRWVETLRQGKMVSGAVYTLPPDERAILEAQSILSLAIAPIFVEEHLWGFIGFDDCTRERRWSIVEADALLAAANTLGVAIQRHTQERFLNTLNDITLTTLNASSAEDALTALVHRLKEVFQTESIAIATWDEANRLLTPIATTLPPEEYAEKELPLYLKQGETSLTEIVLRSGHAIVLEDLQNSEQIAARARAQVPSLHGMLGLPLIANERPLGALLVGYPQPRNFTKAEIARGEQAAAQLALAIAKTRLDEQIRQHADELEARVAARTSELQTANRQLYILNTIAQRIATTLEMDDLLQTVADLIRDELLYYFVAIGLLEGDEIVFKVAAGGEHPLVPKLRLHIPDEGLSGWVAAQRRLLNVPDISQEPRYYSSSVSTRARSALVVPIQSQERFFGVLSIDSDVQRAFGESEEQLFSAIAHQLALALENARSFAEAKKQRDEAQHAAELLFEQSNHVVGMNRIVSSLMGAATLRDAAQVLISGLKHEFRVTKSALWITDLCVETEAPPRLILAAQAGINLPPEESIRPGDNTEPLFQAWKRGKRIWRTGYTGETYCDQVFDRWLMHPVQVQERTLAMLVVEDDSIDADTLQMLLNQAALGLAAARAHERLQQQANALDNANRELQRATQAKTEFINRMSHELRTPLNAIMGFANLLRRKRTGPLNEKQVRFVDNILESADHQLALVNDVLDLAKVEAGKLSLHTQHIPVLEVITSAINLVQNQAAERELQLVSKLPREDIVVQADPVRLRQIVLNLLTNAIKFTPKGGEICVQYAIVDELPETAPPAVIQAHNFPALLLSVRDTGIGIAPQDFEKVFSEFEQIESPLNRAHEGTGLGLALTRQLVHLHAGSIWFESEIKKGTTFFVTLPLTGNSPPTDKAPAHR